MQEQLERRLGDNGFFSIESAATGVEEGTPRYTDRLEQNFPNPFNGTDRKGNPVIYFCRIVSTGFSKSIKINYVR